MGNAGEDTSLRCVAPCDEKNLRRQLTTLHTLKPYPARAEGAARSTNAYVPAPPGRGRPEDTLA